MPPVPSNARPPMPVQSQRWAGKALLIVGLILAMMVAVAVLAIYIGVRILTHNVSIREIKEAGGASEVAVKTPVGKLEIHQGAVDDVGLLGLPVYPGARRITDNGNARVTAEFAGRSVMGMLAAKFETPDSMARVKRFYDTRLNGQVTRYIQKNSEGKTVFEIKAAGQEKIVALKSENGGTRIELVKLAQGENAAN